MRAWRGVGGGVGGGRLFFMTQCPVTVTQTYLRMTSATDLLEDDFGHTHLLQDDFGHTHLLQDDFGHTHLLQDDFGHTLT